MLVNLEAILAPAAEGDYGVAAFNVFGWEDARAVVNAAEKIGAPVILSANLDFTRFMPVEVIAFAFRSLAEEATVPVCAHLDHTYEKDAVKRAVDAGFTSVMFDGSQLPLEENIAGTRELVEYARSSNCSVEAEIGSVPYSEGRDHIRSELTDADEAARLAEESGLHALAISIGNIHRLKSPGAEISLDRLAAIERRVLKPLVIHGTSGIYEDDLRRLVKTRVAKFNIGTCLRQAFGRGLRQVLDTNQNVFDRLEIMNAVMPLVASEALRMIRLLGWPEEP